MVDTIIILLAIQFIIVFIIDLSGFIDTLNSFIFKLFFKQTYNGEVLIPKPFNCSLCMGWWLNLIYLYYTDTLTIQFIAIVALLAYFSDSIITILNTIKDMLGLFNNIIINKFNKLYK